DQNRSLLLNSRPSNGLLATSPRDAAMAPPAGQGLSEALQKRLGPRGSMTDSVQADRDKLIFQDGIPTVSLVEDVAFAAQIKLSISGIQNWCETQWGSGLSIRFLEKGFFFVLFRSVAQKDNTMARKCFLLSDSGLAIREWEPHFDCNRADTEGLQVW
ncbi:hypothetical protein KI387_029587, partial [Taxus chinensis]